jgi:hypothetical protein
MHAYPTNPAAIYLAAVVSQALKSDYKIGAYSDRYIIIIGEQYCFRFEPFAITKKWRMVGAHCLESNSETGVNGAALDFTNHDDVVRNVRFNIYQAISYFNPPAQGSGK